MLAEISYRRNKIEKSLRTIVKNTLKFIHKKKAGTKVLAALPESRRGLDPDINFLLHKDDSPLFFLDLVHIITKEWGTFESVFEMDKAKAVFILSEINDIGRPDAHAKGITKDCFTQTRLHFKTIEKIITDWE